MKWNVRKNMKLLKLQGKMARVFLDNLKSDTVKIQKEDAKIQA